MATKRIKQKRALPKTVFVTRVYPGTSDEYLSVIKPEDIREVDLDSDEPTVVREYVFTGKTYLVAKTVKVIDDHSG